MAMNDPQGRGGYTGSNDAVRGQFPPPDPLEDPQAAVARAMRMIGLNPGNISPLSNRIRKQANALVNQLVVNAGNAGEGAIEALAQPAQALGMLADLLRQGVSGGKIFGGGGNALSNLARIADTAGAGGEGGSPGARLIASILSNPNDAEALFVQGKYGGLSDRAQAASTTALADIMDQYRSQVEGNPSLASTAGGILRMLLGQPMGSGFGAPQGVEGAGGAGGANGILGGMSVPSTATPANPSMLQNPAAAQLPNPAGAMGGYGQGMMNSSLGGLLGAGGGAPGFGASRPGGADIPGAGLPGMMPQQMMPPGNSFQPMSPGNYLPEPLATLMRIQQGLGR